MLLILVFVTGLWLDLLYAHYLGSLGIYEWNVFDMPCYRYGFKSPPKLTLVAKPRLGNREVKLSRVTHWIERKLQELVNVS